MRSRLPTVIWQAAEKAKEDLTPRVPIIPPTQLLVLEFRHFLSQIPPTQLADRSYSAYKGTSARPAQIPPTQLVDRSYSACVCYPRSSIVLIVNLQGDAKNQGSW
jgi:hypothetical protein